MRLMSVLLVGFVCSFSAWAEPAPVEGNDGVWSGNADLGFSASTGNSDTRNLNTASNVDYLKGLWTHGLRFTAVRQDDDGTTNAERYEAGYKAQRALSDVSYLFGNLAFERDEFGGVYQRSSETIGYGRKLLNTDVHTLKAEIGVGARQSELQDGTEEQDAIVRLGADYMRILSDSAAFNQSLIVESGEENTYVESISALKVRINGNLYAKLSYTVKYNDTVPAGTEDTDTFTTLSLSYEFGKH